MRVVDGVMLFDWMRSLAAVMGEQAD